MEKYYCPIKLEECTRSACPFYTNHKVWQIPDMWGLDVGDKYYIGESCENPLCRQTISSRKPTWQELIDGGFHLYPQYRSYFE